MLCKFKVLCKDEDLIVCEGHGGAVVTHSPPTSGIRVLNPGLTQCGKAGSCLLLVSSLKYRTLTNCMY